jgi:carboxyl-terminal processing protease
MKGTLLVLELVFSYKDSVTIIKPVANGPSARAGIKAGDRILYADKRSFGRKLPSDSLFSRLKEFRSTVNYLSKIKTKTNT